MQRRASKTTDQELLCVPGLQHIKPGGFAHVLTIALRAGDRYIAAERLRVRSGGTARFLPARLLDGSKKSWIDSSSPRTSWGVAPWRAGGVFMIVTLHAWDADVPSWHQGALYRQPTTCVCNVAKGN